MFHLIKLELKKGSFTGYIWGSLIAYLTIAGLMMIVYFVEGNNIEEPVFQGYTDMLHMIDLLVRATFIVYASVMISKLIINEFKDKTISLLFAYPVSRKKIIFAKLSIVFFWTFANVLLANLVVGALLISINAGVGYFTEPLTIHTLVQHAIYVLMQAIGAAGMSLLPLAIGMRNKSVPSTIVSSIVIVVLVCSNNLGFSISSIIAIPLSLAVIGILITYMSFRNIDRMDVG
ncbi:ABC-2 family transporter protein [Paenibacillus algorifonticola]|uniref:ABC-2 family transporter protein n=1 Tax=Paenibacillus algorifonticola TaxID=684063 RepID=A0A1I1YSV5_9BACL|nr:ABC transporter permease [Paenibacillus algorifonticola]SFE22626.1 ABC-2 family transporter protein [Paenibacillus algorifonticola]